VPTGGIPANDMPRYIRRVVERNMCNVSPFSKESQHEGLLILKDRWYNLTACHTTAKELE